MPIIEVDGDEYEFPDDMPETEIKAALQKRFGSPQKQSPGIARGLLAGIDRGVSDVSDTLGAVTGVNYLRDKAARGLENIGFIPKGSAERMAPEARKKRFDDEYGDSTAATIGRVGANVATTIIPGIGVAGKVGQAIKAAPLIGKAASKAPAILRGVGAAGVEGATSSLLTSKGYDNDVIDSAVEAGLTDAALSGLGRGIVKPLVKSVPAALTGRYGNARSSGNETYDAAVKTLEDELPEIPITPAQRGNSRYGKYLEEAFAQIPLTGRLQQKTFDKQKAKFTAALLREVGQESETVNPEVLGNILNTAGDKYNKALQGKTIDVSGLDRADFDNVLTEAEEFLTLDQQNNLRAVLKNSGILPPIKSKDGKNIATGAIYRAFATEPMQAEKFAKTRKDIKGLLRNQNSPAIQKAMAALDDLAERSEPGLIEALKKADANYTIARAIVDLGQSNSKDMAEGYINPSALNSKLSKFTDPRSMSKAARLAAAGSKVLKDLPDSGTAQRADAMRVVKGLGWAGAAGGAGLVSPWLLPVPYLAQGIYSGLGRTAKDGAGEGASLTAKAKARALRRLTSETIQDRENEGGF